MPQLNVKFVSSPWLFSGSVLVALMLLGGGLRFWQLDSKPLWLDEVITALFSLGRSYTNIPLEQLLPLSALTQLFSYQPGQSCAQIAARVTTESVHPPLFFCAMYGWMGWLTPWTENWIWALRSLSALFGVGAIAAMYHLNRVAVSPQAGLVAAGLMAVSPFTVYLSQEARHYTLPMLIITLALAALVQMQRNLLQQRYRPWLWLGWVALNLLGLYVHYFCALAVVAQVGALLLWMGVYRYPVRRGWGVVGLAIAGIGLGYLPWLPTFISHITRPETDWLEPYDPSWLDRLAPLYQLLSGLVLMVVSLPVENQSLAIALAAGVAMLAFAGWLVWQAVPGWRSLWQQPLTRAPLGLLSGFTLLVLIQFLGIVYVLNKDITVVPRYNFIFYPGICALLGAAIAARSSTASSHDACLSKLLHNRLALIALLVGVVSSVVVVNNGSFQKSYSPDVVAQTLYFEPQTPLAVVVSYRSLQEVALGLSFGIELERLHRNSPQSTVAMIAFVGSEMGNNQVWRSLRTIEQPMTPPLNLWVIATPSLKLRNFPDALKINNPSRDRKAICQRDSKHTYRLGFPYQLYRCQP